LRKISIKKEGVELISASSRGSPGGGSKFGSETFYSFKTVESVEMNAFHAFTE
jgi:hypothetical protein